MNFLTQFFPIILVTGICYILYIQTTFQRTVKKGKHYFKPFPLKVGYRKYSIKVGINESMKYELEPSSDGINRQNHWSKLVGINFTPWKNRYNVVMVGWHYDNKTDLFYLTPYWHDSGSKEWVKKSEACTVKLEEGTVWVDIVIICNKNSISMFIGDEIFSIDMVQKFPLYIEQPTYFGGKEPAPNEMTVFFDKLKMK